MPVEAVPLEPQPFSDTNFSNGEASGSLSIGPWSSVVLFCFETGSHCVSLALLELTV